MFVAVKNGHQYEAFFPLEPGGMRVNRENTVIAALWASFDEFSLDDMSEVRFVFEDGSR